MPEGSDGAVKTITLVKPGSRPDATGDFGGLETTEPGKPSPQPVRREPSESKRARAFPSEVSSHRAARYGYHRVHVNL